MAGKGRSRSSCRIPSLVPIRRMHPRALLRQAHRAAPCSRAAPVCPARLFPRDFCSCPPPLTIDAVVCQAHQQFMVVGFGAWSHGATDQCGSVGCPPPADSQIRWILAGQRPTCRSEPASTGRSRGRGAEDRPRATYPAVTPRRHTGQGEDRDRQAFFPCTPAVPSAPHRQRTFAGKQHCAANWTANSNTVEGPLEFESRSAL
jgi:hypothetical protein